jgi:hypothetical protein
VELAAKSACAAAAEVHRSVHNSSAPRVTPHPYFHWTRESITSHAVHSPLVFPSLQQLEDSPS